MSLSLGVILIAKDFGHQHEALLTAIDVAPAEAAGPISLDEAVSREFEHTAIGTYNGTTLVVNQFLPYDCSFEEGEMYYLDERLMVISEEAAVLCFFMDGISGTYGFAKFVGGEKVRWRAVDPETILIDEGAPLPAERGFAPDEHNDQERIFVITEEFLGVRFDQLIAAGDLLLTEYRSTDE